MLAEYLLRLFYLQKVLNYTVIFKKGNLDRTPNRDEGHSWLFSQLKWSEFSVINIIFDEIMP